MKYELTRLEKVVILSCLYTRAKLVEKYQNKTEQLDLFGGFNSIDLDYIFKVAQDENEITSEIVASARDIIHIHEINNIQIIDYFSEKYPSQMRSVIDAPFILYVKGNLSALNRSCVAIVGARDASDFGKKVSHDYAYSLAKKDLCIVSGLAVGIDVNAHQGALDANGYTVAILASAPDKIYPDVNKAVAQRIIDNNGALVSEHPIGYGLFKSEFVRRNRIQSGMSKCSIIIESRPDSGSAHQAEWCFKQKRQIFVIEPDRFTVDNSDFSISGANFFKDKYGAIPVKASEGLALINKFIESTQS